MRRARIRHFVLIGLVLLAAASMFTSLGGGSKSERPRVSTERTRYESTARQDHPRATAPGALPPIDTWAER
jgi:hypothetical protein